VQIGKRPHLQKLVNILTVDWMWKFMPVIPAMQEAEMRGSQFEGSLNKH
jgi:hypothetical protein